MKSIDNLDKLVPKAIAYYWLTRQKQSQKQTTSGRSDQAARSAVTGGAQMDGFISLITRLIVEAGADEANIFHNTHLELPGFFRPTKEWDLLLVKDDQLVLALQAKAQVGSSPDSNFSDTKHKAIGSALDLWSDYRDGSYNRTFKPWLGYLFLLEDTPESRRSVRSQDPPFKVLTESAHLSYRERYELFCRRLVRERHYCVAAYLISNKTGGLKGRYAEPADDLAFATFARALVTQVAAFGVSGKRSLEKRTH